MDEQDFDAFVYVAMFLADRSGGRLQQQELRSLLRTVAKLGTQWGVRPVRAAELAASLSQRFISERDDPDARLVASRFLERIDLLRDHADAQRLLPRLYQDLVRVAGADGEIQHSEKDALATIRERWALAA